MKIRIAREDDLDVINDIYNQYVGEPGFTAHTEKVGLEERKDWFNRHDDRYPVFVSLNDKGRVSGWISLSPYRPGRKALKHTTEISYYLNRNERRKGIGSDLMTFVIAEAKKRGFRNLIAILLENNPSSIGLLEKFGFKKWGHLPKVADFNGVEIGQYYYGLRISQPKL